MSYTDNKPAPAPTASERAFSQLTDEEREAMTMQWLWRHVHLSAVIEYRSQTDGVQDE